MDQTTSLNSPPSAGTEGVDAPANSKPGKWVSLNHYSSLYGFSRSSINKAIKNGSLKFRRDGNLGWRQIWDDSPIIPSANPLESVAFIKTTEAAIVTGISLRTIQWFIKNGRMQAVLQNKRYYTTIAEVRKIIEWQANRHRHGARKKHARQAVIELVRQKLLRLK